MIDGIAVINGFLYFSDTPRYLNATKERHRRGNEIIDPNLNPAQPWIICKHVAKDTEGDYYYQAIPELPVEHAVGKEARYPLLVDNKTVFRLDKRWLIAWYPQAWANETFNPSRYLFSIFKKEYEAAMLTYAAELIRVK